MSKPLATLRSVADLRKQVAAWRKKGEKVALIPTMGALHAGHLSLVEVAKRRCDRAIVSIFVNPAQFAPHEDFDRYPRDEQGDKAKLMTVGTDLVFAPERREMYPEGFVTRVTAGGPAEGLEGQFRPHFFTGVSTVVAKLLLQCLPDIAYFGEKDYQQLLVVKRMVRDLNIPVEIVGVETMREKDGLAMSSRNAYLGPTERKTAALLNKVIRQVAEKVGKGGNVSSECTAAIGKLEAAGFHIDYLEVRGAEELRPIRTTVRGPARVLVAAWLGKTRLIDNVPTG
jgi:pantoate--beta-alanine ligase